MRQRLRTLSPAERTRLLAMGGVVAALHVVGFGLLLTVGGVLGAGVGVTAYTLGLRHAFDADHIGAIDNATRKLMEAGQRPLSVGFFFSLGHSTIVFGLAMTIAAGVRGIVGAVEDDSSTLQHATGLVGPLVSGSFLLLIGLLNLVVLASIVRIFRGMRHGALDERELERRLQQRGLASRVFARATRAVDAPWHMYPLGCLFGLGFDTATEVALLIVASGAAAGGLPFYAVLCLPLLFAAGMSLLDTLDGAFMRFAYGWAFAQPARKVYYNITITGLSVVVALAIGSIELLAVLAGELDLHGGLWTTVGDVDLNLLGYAIVALFALTWLGALVVWRLTRMEARWSSTRRS